MYVDIETLKYGLENLDLSQTEIDKLILEIADLSREIAGWIITIMPDGTVSKYDLEETKLKVVIAHLEDDTPLPPPTDDPFPYQIRIINVNKYVRGGPGDYYMATGVVNIGDILDVIGEQDNYLQIDDDEWISKYHYERIRT